MVPGTHVGVDVLALCRSLDGCLTLGTQLASTTESAPGLAPGRKEPDILKTTTP